MTDAQAPDARTPGDATVGVAVRPVSIASAIQACDRWHRHLPPPAGGVFALSAWVADCCVGVAVVGRPAARALDDGATLEVSRLATDGSVRGAASVLLRACVREAAARGVERVTSYTMLGEVGACYRAARWRPVAVTRGGSWARASRPRRTDAHVGRKVRWEAGALARPRSMAAHAMIEAHAGRVALPTRPVATSLPWPDAATGRPQERPQTTPVVPPATQDDGAPARGAGGRR